MTAPLWTAAEAARATGGVVAGDWTATGVSIDSRAIVPGDLFIALVGPNNDGHDHVAAALAAGAVAAMVHRAPDGVDTSRLLVVGDTLAGLTALGSGSRDRTGARVIAVTGSAGKTGTKEALRHVLAASGHRVHAAEKSFNNHWGVPLTLARMPRDTEFAVIEVGMNHAGEIRDLVRIVRPDVAVITTIAPAHLAALGSLEAIADAKAEIFEGLVPGGAAVLPADNAQYGRLRQRASECGVGRILTFGFTDTADYHVVRAAIRAEKSCVDARLGDHEAAFCVAVPGEHWVANSLAVLAAVAAAGGDVGRAAPALARFTPLAGRGERHRVAVQGGEILLIDESYNANPASMRAALSVLGAADVEGRGRRVAVLGDMLELGETAGELHADLAEAVLAAADLAMLCGPHMAGLADRLAGRIPVMHAENSGALKPLVLRGLRAGDAVLVKGSLGSRMGPLVMAIRDAGAAGTAQVACG